MPQDFKNKRVIVMGLGICENGVGIEAVKFFLRRGAKVLVTDQKDLIGLRKQVEELKSCCKKSKLSYVIVHPGADHKGEKDLVFVLGRHRNNDFKNVDLVFQNPSVPADSEYLQIARQARIPIVNDWSIFLAERQPKLFVGVTGTRGKSTTATLIYKMMQKKYKNVILCGNIGGSPLMFIDSYKGEPLVAELSSWLLHHFNGQFMSPQIAVVTNIMRDHLNKYGSMNQYIADKERIFRFQKKNDILVLNKNLLSMGKKAKGKVIWFDNRKIFDSKLIGEHNIANVNAAVAVAKCLKIPEADIRAVLKLFTGLKDRLELVGSINGVNYYNDTTATTPEATIAALKALGNKKNIVLIAGGADKKLDFKELPKYVKLYCKAVILLPGTATLKMKIKGIEVKDMKQAVAKARRLAKKGDSVVLSPGAASFGLFANEFDRGNKFINEIKKYV